MSQTGDGIKVHLYVLAQLCFFKKHISPDGYLNKSPTEEDDNQTKPSRQVTSLQGTVLETGFVIQHRYVFFLKRNNLGLYFIHRSRSLLYCLE